MILVLPDLVVQKVMQALDNTTGLWQTDNLVFVALFTNNFVPTKDTVLSDFVELTVGQVPGYVRNLIYFNDLSLRQQDGTWEDNWIGYYFFATSKPVVPVVVYGFFVVDYTTGDLLGSGSFATPFTFADIYDGFYQAAGPTYMEQNGGALKYTLPDLDPA